MNTPRHFLCAASLLLMLSACHQRPVEHTAVTDTLSSQGTYAYDASFLKKYSRKVIELKSENGDAKVLLSADYQGRVMTSTAAGDSGSSFGWINYGLISSGEKKQHMNPVGGEERFWMGPEGGQYSIYFKKGDSFNYAHWFVPAVLDTVTYDITQSDKSQA